MNTEEIDKISYLLENQSCLLSPEDEILKLYLLFQDCGSDKENYLHRNYVLEKVQNLLTKRPILLGNGLYKKFIGIKLSIDANQSNDPQEM